MQTTFYTDNARPCWKCEGTVAEYTTDDIVSLISVKCIVCNTRDCFHPGNPKVFECVAEISAIHRSIR